MEKEGKTEDYSRKSMKFPKGEIKETEVDSLTG